MRKCRFFKKHFTLIHFNQYLCSDICKVEQTKAVKRKYEKSDKGIESNKRWTKSETFKKNEFRYRQKPTAKKKAVQRANRYLLSNPKARLAKKRRDRIYMSRTQGKLRKWWDIVSKNGCVSCGSDKNIGVDHMIPISLGGSDDITNLQVLCKKCNSSKGCRDV